MDRVRPLNKGRSVNSGDTPIARSTNGLRSGRAQQRPERKLRRHPSHRELPSEIHIRSRKAGVQTPATPSRYCRRRDDKSALNKGRNAKSGDTLPCRWPQRSLRSLNKGRNASSSDNCPYSLKVPFTSSAQQRPERKLRRHPSHRRLPGEIHVRSTKAGVQSPATRRRRRPASSRGDPLNKGRSTNSGDTRSESPDHVSTSTVAQQRPERKLRRQLHDIAVVAMIIPRSTKAGTQCPATPSGASPTRRRS